MTVLTTAILVVKDSSFQKERNHFNLEVECLVLQTITERLMCDVAGSPCEHDGNCVNTPGSFACNCTQGFTGPRCETNVNECESHPCQNDGSCLDDPGTFRCVCMPGQSLGHTFGLAFSLQAYLALLHYGL
uniref:EGF-like domain-containing protein n=1 Tax=Timema monikensis TaxID=170555 RepID=A0A7R9HN56_9NEOP|nr:unnamed protein product [Timema monikensis]